MKYQVVGNLSTISLLKKMNPDVSYAMVDRVLNGDDFWRWYKRNEKTLERTTFAAVPTLTMAMFGLDPTLWVTLTKGQAVAAGAFGFLAGDGQIILWFLGIGILTMVVSIFLKVTGRADLIPILGFVSCTVLLIQVIKLFTTLYHSVSTLLNM